MVVERERERDFFNISQKKKSYLMTLQSLVFETILRDFPVESLSTLSIHLICKRHDEFLNELVRRKNRDSFHACIDRTDLVRPDGSLYRFHREYSGTLEDSE